MVMESNHEFRKKVIMVVWMHCMLAVAEKPCVIGYEKIVGQKKKKMVSVLECYRDRLRRYTKDQWN